MGRSWRGVIALLLVLLLRSGEAADYPPLDGRGNNKRNPTWGAAGTPFIRTPITKSSYTVGADGVGSGANRPSPRAVTLALLQQPYFKEASRFNTSYLLTALGLIITQDITGGNSDSKTSNGGSGAIEVPVGDPLFSVFNTQGQLMGPPRQLNYTRNAYTRSADGGPREQINVPTHWVDASIIYGFSPEVLRVLRAGTAGRMLDDGHRLLPLNVDDDGKRKLEMRNTARRLPQTALRLSGNTGVNQSPHAHVLTTLLLREHNRRAMSIERENPSMSDDEVFQEARKFVIAHMQQLTFGEYLNALGAPLPPYKAYNSSINPSVDNFFTAASFRYGHSTITDTILRLDENGREHPKGHLTLLQAWFAPDVFLTAGIEPILRGLIATPQGHVEPRWSSSVAGNMFGYGGVNGTDLAAIDIQRGRDQGIPDYNTCRRYFGLAPAKAFTDITPDRNVAAILEDLYGSVDNIDAYIGGLAEPHHASSHVGALFYASIVDQFTRLRDGDYYYYENKDNGLFTDAQIAEIRSTTLRDLILRNTDIASLPADIWTAAGFSLSGSGSGGAAGSNKDSMALSALMGGGGKLEVKPDTTEEGWVQVSLSAPDGGWLGFGVAQQGSRNAMIGADMVIGSFVNGRPVVKRYRAVAHAAPEEIPASGTDRLRVIKFEQSGGRTLLEFRRPTAGSSSADNALPMPADQAVTLIVAHGPGPELSTMMAAYHGMHGREVINLPNGIYGSFAVQAGSPAITKRRAHGVLMSVNFIVILPLGALAARQLRAHWIKSPSIKAILFYAHIVCQVTGCAILTSGFVIATRFFELAPIAVAYGHGVIGIVLMALTFSQLLLGFVRPPGHVPTKWRWIWDILHTLLGHLAISLGILNVILGIYIFVSWFGGNFVLWYGLCGAGLGVIQLAKLFGDVKEKHAVLEDELQHAGPPSDVSDDEDADAPPTKGSVADPSLATASRDAHAHSTPDTLAAAAGKSLAGKDANGGSLPLTESSLRQHNQNTAAGVRHQGA